MSNPQSTPDVVAEHAASLPERVAALEAALRQARAEAALAHTRLDALTNHLREGLLLFDDQYQVVLLNERLCEFFRIARPLSQWVGKPLDVLTSHVRDRMADPNAYDINVRELLERLSTGEHFSMRLTLNDGHTMERDVLRVSLGEASGWLCTYRDITEQLATERERDKQRLFYEAVLDELPVEVAVLDEHFRYVYANYQAEPDPEKRAWLLSGHTVAEFCERYGFPLSLAEHRARMFRQAEQSDEPVFWDDRTPKPGGDLVHQRQFKLLSKAGQPGRPYMLGAGLDITARVRAEERSQRSEAAVREQQEFMEQVFDTTPNAIFVRDAQGRLLFGNFMMAELTTLLARPGAVPSEGHPWQPATDAPVLAQGQELATEETLTLPGGELRWYHTVRRLLERPDGSRQVLGVSTDITDLKTAQLAAEAAAQARENFLANMSHEIRTPMNGVLGIAGLLAKTPLTAQQQDYLRTIRSSGNHLLSLLNDVLDVAKINSGKLELEEVPFNLMDSVRQTITPLALQAEEKGLSFQIECPSQTAWVLSDPFRLNQVLLNLLSNAIKFTERGTVELRLSVVAELPALRIVRFEVRDTGIGIKPEALARIFDSFTQAYADTSRRFGGTGLGLTISRALVSKLGGELSVASEHGQGSSFSFTLPLPVATAPAPGEQPNQLADGLLHGTHMLLAEDNDVNRLVASLHLERWGVRVDEAVDGLAALQCLRETTYDLVLMDIQMPGMSGLDVTRHLRRMADPERAATPVLALTANAFRNDNEKYLAAGLNDYLAKPFAEEDLYGKLVALLQRQPVAALPALASVVPTLATPPPPAPAATSYSLTRLRAEAKGQEAFVKRMLRAFLASTPPKLDELQAAAAAHDWLKVAEIAHFLKPNLRLLAMETATNAALLLETATQDGDASQYQGLVQQLLAATEATLQELPADL